VVKAELYGWVRMFTELYGAAGLSARHYRFFLGKPLTQPLKISLISPITPIKTTTAADQLTNYTAPNTGGDPPTHKATADKTQ